MHKLRSGAATAAALALLATAGTTVTADAAQKPHAFKNCTALNAHFPHGVGMPGAHDKTSGDPVTNFTRSKAWYRKNTKRDRDKDRIACEKH